MIDFLYEIKISIHVIDCEINQYYACFINKDINLKSITNKTHADGSNPNSKFNNQAIFMIDFFHYRSSFRLSH